MTTPKPITTGRHKRITAHRHYILIEDSADATMKKLAGGQRGPGIDRAAVIIERILAAGKLGRGIDRAAQIIEIKDAEKELVEKFNIPGNVISKKKFTPATKKQMREFYAKILDDLEKIDDPQILSKKGVK